MSGASCADEAGAWAKARRCARVAAAAELAREERTERRVWITAGLVSGGVSVLVPAFCSLSGRLRQMESLMARPRWDRPTVIFWVRRAEGEVDGEALAAARED